MRVVAILGSLGIFIGLALSNASESDNLKAQTKRIEVENTALDQVYQRILTVLNRRIEAGEAGARNFKNALVEAERAWIKWRDAEALMRAYADGAVGGSALTEDFHSNVSRLINERREFLGSILRQSGDE